ncbi:PAS domain S-box protein [Paraburkholderia sp. CNPSo 3272]|uniref:hybrid sensor histidine kinase/response regulator n=1 Tax=Paraburkholderia sp. CNPSo 3272 TaxID=2940931 RepID=UPI0020B70065|nr:PAS domain-containing sensor histidine kinase [Paraburkholderia sp. CNPSo 3272]MCP3727524.1 PAS domain S-box protein [Paraburkholderia sp. CNPSo 3272]
MFSRPSADGLSPERRFELMISGVRDYAIYFLDRQGFVSSWNAGAERFKGYRADEIIGRHFSVFYTPEDQASGLPARALRTALADGKFETEAWRVRKDGSCFWASVVLDPIFDEAGEHVGFVKITRDISERKAAQEALLESERSFRLLVQGVTDYAIFMLSPEGIVTNWNPGAQRIKGYTEQEIVGRHFGCFYTEEDREKGMPAATLIRASTEGRSEHEGWRVRRDGTRFWAHVVVDAIRDSDGHLLGFAKVTRDVTERREAAAALERANAQLFQAQKMEAIGQLTGGIAHDFNNLLAVISSSLDVLGTQPPPHVAARMQDAMRRAVTRGSTLTQQLLSFARQQPLKPETCQLDEVIEGFESMLRRAVPSSMSLEIRASSGDSLVNVDVVRFEAALLNLVVNARDAIAGSGQIDIRTGSAELRDGDVPSLRAGRYLRVQVTDTGCGMSPEIIARATEPFFTTKEPGKGTGLGLSQVYGFISQSGGAVDIASEPGRGTTVSLYLPAVEHPAATAARLPATDVAETVLVVDDESEVLEATAELFRSIGYAVVTASTAAEAISRLERDSEIDFLFTDVVMSGAMDGLELARRARHMRSGLRVVVASGHISPSRHGDGELDDFVFIAKPYRLAELARAMRRAAEASRRAQDA